MYDSIFILIEINVNCQMHMYIFRNCKDNNKFCHFNKFDASGVQSATKFTKFVKL